MQVLYKHARGNAYFAYVVRGGGGSRDKMLILQNSYSPVDGYETEMNSILTNDL